MLFHPSVKTISRYLDGALPEKRARRFEAHIEDCVACRRKVEVLQSLGTLCRAPQERLDAMAQAVMARVKVAAGPPRETDAPVAGEITWASGTVRVRRNAEDEAVEVFPGCVVREGDQVEPAEDAAALIEWERGGSLRVERPTVLTPAMIAASSESSTKRTGRTIMKVRNRKRLRWALACATVAAAGAVLGIVIPRVKEKSAFEPHIYTRFDSEGELGVELPAGKDDDSVLNGPDMYWNDVAAKELHLNKTPRSRGGGEYAGTGMNIFADPRVAQQTLHGRGTGAKSGGDVWRSKDKPERRWSLYYGGALESASQLYVSDGTNTDSQTVFITSSPDPLAFDVDGDLDFFAQAARRQSQLVALSTDGKRATGEADGTARIWDAKTGTELLSLKGHSGKVQAVAFSPDGQQLASAGADKTVRLWDVTTGEELTEIATGYAAVSLAFSPDGSRLTTLADENTAKLWDAESGQLLGTIERHVANAEAYDEIVENPFLEARAKPLSTFAIDVDTASYANVRRFLNNNQRPPRNAVRIEEMINYFSYNYPQPQGDDPFSVSLEISDCPWNDAHRLVNVGLKGKEIARDQRPPSNLVFLLDVSGSMSPDNKLPLVKQAMKMLVENLTENDRVAIVVYAGASGLVLDSTSCANKNAILETLDRLKSGGSTNGGEGIVLAYKLALDNFIEGGVNRVILCTDGDFNVGITSRDDLIQLIEEEATMGTFLTVLGFGMGNLKDATLEQLADKGNGNYGYIDTLAEAQKTLVEQLSGTLVTIAKDVKIQIEFNPEEVAGYRLIGYENRMLRAQDFNDDTKDAGEIGAGHRVTALYEIVPAGGAIPVPERQGFVSTETEPVATPEEEETAETPEPEDDGDVDPLRYQEFGQPTEEAKTGEMLTVKLRYKEPDGHKSKLLAFPIKDEGLGLDRVSVDYRFAAAVAAFGMILRDSQYKGTATLDSVLGLAERGRGDDRWGYRAEFIELVKKARTIFGN